MIHALRNARAVFFLALLAALGATPIHALTLTYSDQPLQLRVHPQYRVDIQFPDTILRVSGTTPKGGFTFLREGSLLTVRPVNWPQDDPRYQLRTTINVFLPARAYQIDITPDWTATDQLIVIDDPHYEQFRKDSKQFAPIDRMFLAFIRNAGILPFSQDQAIDTIQKLPNGWVLHLDRLYRVTDYEFLHGELQIPVLHLPVLPSDLDALNVYPGRMGEVHIPDLENLDPKRQTLKNVTRPVFFLYARRQQ